MLNFEVEAFVSAMRNYSPRLSAMVGPEASRTGVRWIDIRLGERLSSISWDAERGFAFYDEDAPGYGHEIPLATLRDPIAAADHEAKILLARGWRLSRGPIATAALRIR